MTPRKPPPTSVMFPALCGPITRRIVTLIERNPGIKAADIAADVYRDARRLGAVHVHIREIRQRYLPPGWRIRSRPAPTGGGYWLEQP